MSSGERAAKPCIGTTERASGSGATTKGRRLASGRAKISTPSKSRLAKMGGRGGASGCASARRSAGASATPVGVARPRARAVSLEKAKPICLAPWALCCRPSVSRSSSAWRGSRIAATAPAINRPTNPAIISRAVTPSGGAAAGTASLRPLEATSISSRPTGVASKATAAATPASAAIAVPRLALALFNLSTFVFVHAAARLSRDRASNSW